MKLRLPLQSMVFNKAIGHDRWKALQNFENIATEIDEVIHKNRLYPGKKYPIYNPRDSFNRQLEEQILYFLNP